MSSIKTLIRENINDIVNDLNEELLQDRIVRFWDKVNTIDRKMIKSKGNLPMPHSERAIANVVSCI